MLLALSLLVVVAEDVDGQLMVDDDEEMVDRNENVQQ